MDDYDPCEKGWTGIKRFTWWDFFGGLCHFVLVPGVTLTVVWTEGFHSLPNLPLAILVLVPMVASVAAWSYFGTGRRKDGWITAGLFGFFGVPMVVLGLIES